MGARPALRATALALALVLFAGTAHAARNCGVGEVRTKGGCVCAFGYGTSTGRLPCR